MNQMTEPALSVTPAVPAYRAGQRVTLIRVMHSEWTKLWSLPSTLWLLLITVALVAGGGLLAAVLQLSSLPHGAAAVAAFDPTQLSLTGVGLAELTAGALGVLIMTGEYATGQVRLTFTAVPRRLPVLWGKTAALAVAMLAVATVATFAAFFIAQAILAPHHLSTTLAQPGVARALFGSALVLTGVALLGLGLGALLRNAAGAVSTLFGVLYGLTIAAGFLPGRLAGEVREYLPENASADVTRVAAHQAGSFSAWAGFGLFCLYIAVALAASAWLLRRRDA
ncbi:MAG TPA: ABC transporter permease subunit [Streptosporangiaceae bacterium]|jgi:ABC-type transport system involved in multi-copper enzyme maturation permease subunit